MDEEDFGLGDDDAVKDLNHRVDEMKQAFMNEKEAPELLPFEDEVVEELLKDVHRQQGILDQGGDDASEKFTIELYQMEIDRIKYLLSSYLRTRITKIEQHPRFALQDAEMRGRLSAEELRFATGLVALNDQHAHRLVLSRLPENYRRLDQQGQEVDMVPRPDLDQYVCCRIGESIGSVEDHGAGASVNLVEGESLILRYAVVRDYVVDGRVALF